MVQKGFVYTIAAYIYAFRPAFSIKTYCILHHFTLRLAPKHTAFSTKMHCVLRHIALRFAANCSTFSRKQPQMWYRWCPFLIYIHFAAFTGYPPLLHQNKPSRESIFCGKVGSWWIKMALIVLKFLLKTRQDRRVVNTREWATARKTCTLTTTRANDCRACGSWLTGTKSWKRRSRTPSTVGFRLVEKAVKDFRQINF